MEKVSEAPSAKQLKRATTPYVRPSQSMKTDPTPMK
jgi:hypothetical protein